MMIQRFGPLGVGVCLFIGATSISTRAGQKSAPAYQVDVAESRVYIKVASETRLGHEHGVEGKFKSGKLTLGEAGELVFDMATFKADTARARKRVGVDKRKVFENEMKKVNATMHGPTVLDVSKFPTATFRIASITPQDKQAAGEPGTYQLKGQFTLHGIEKPLAFKAKLEPAGKDKDGAKMTGTFKLSQTAYGIKPFSTAGGLVKVADDLEIFGDLVFMPAAK